LKKKDKSWVRFALGVFGLEAFQTSRHTDATVGYILLWREDRVRADV